MIVFFPVLSCKIAVKTSINIWQFLRKVSRSKFMEGIHIRVATKKQHFGVLVGAENLSDTMLCQNYQTIQYFLALQHIAYSRKLTKNFDKVWSDFYGSVVQ